MNVDLGGARSTSRTTTWPTSPMCHATGTCVVDELTEERLTEHTRPVTEPCYPLSEAFPVADVVSTIVNQEWWHHQYAIRDLAVLEDRSPRRQVTRAVTGPGAP